MKRIIEIVAGVVVVALIATFVALKLTSGSTKVVTVDFPQAIGIYKGSSVRILGVQVGSISSITPHGDYVQVVIHYNGKYKLPANVGAAIVPPSIVSDRYVQLVPAYQGGPVAPDHWVILPNRTEIPVELDEIFSSLNKLDVAFGPNGANKTGAFSRLVNVGARNLNGNGQQLHDTLQAFSQAIATLGINRGNLFQTITNLQKFTTAIANDDGGVRKFNADLAQVAVQLNGERHDLAQALANLSTALQQVASFVKGNRALVKTDVKELEKVTSNLVTYKRALMEILDDAPLGLGNLSLAYDPDAQTLDTRSNEGELPSEFTSPKVLCMLGVIPTKLCNSLPLPGLPSQGAPAHVRKVSSTLAGLLGAAP